MKGLFAGSILVTLGILGCTKGTPNFGILDASQIPMPQFSGATVLSLTDTTATQTNSVSGQCDSRIHDLQITAVGSSSNFPNAIAFTTSGVNLACGTNGSFAFTLKSLTDLGFQITDHTTYVLQVRGVTDAGPSNPSLINILYSTTGGTGPRRILITSGATLSNTNVPRRAVSSGGSFQAEVRIDHALNDYSNASSQDAMTIKSSAHFRMKSGSAAEND